MGKQAKEVLGVDTLDAVADRGYYSGKESRRSDRLGLARRGQITGVMVDGPLAFDNAISANADKGIVSEVVGNAAIILVPDLVSGNILAKTSNILPAQRSPGSSSGSQCR